MNSEHQNSGAVAAARARVRVVLIETSHPGNIGGAARALKTMGLQHLWLVRPHRYPDPQAEWRAAGALDVLDAATVVGHLSEAIDDCSLVLGTSTRSRRIPWPTLNARQAGGRVCSEPGAMPIAILFGREASGLENDELQRCHAHVQIPADARYASLNLAMAVQVICYEIFIATQGGATTTTRWDRSPATAAELEGMLGHLATVLEEVGFLDADHSGKALTRLRRLFTRVSLDETEVGMLRGILSHIENATQRDDRS